MLRNRSRVRVFAAVLCLIALASLLLTRSPRGLSADTALGYIGPGTFASQTTPSSPWPTQGEAQHPTGSVKGTLVDEEGLPASGVEVELVPLSKTGDQRWYATLRDWTSTQGEYRFTAAEPGEYIVAVQQRSAPDGRHPYFGTYYPGVDNENSADHIYVTPSAPIELYAMRLRKIETVTLKISVAFEDGSRPAWSNLLFHNPSFPNQGVIGDEAPGIENGTGEFTLPVGYHYYARAKVDCDTGTRIETRESRPVQTIEVERDKYPDELTFVIPGSTCPLWRPR